jgi:hypothetical protein
VSDSPTTSSQRLGHFRSLLADSDERLRNEQVRNQALRKVIEGLEVLETVELGSHDSPRARDEVEARATIHTSDESISMSDAVRRILNESDREWKAAELTEEARRRGWVDEQMKDPVDAARQALSQLARAKVIYRSGYGKYKRMTEDLRLMSDAADDSQNASDAQEMAAGRMPGPNRSESSLRAEAPGR